MAFGKFNYKGYKIVPINEGQLKFAVTKDGKVHNKFLSEESAKSWIKTVG